MSNYKNKYLEIKKKYLKYKLNLEFLNQKKLKGGTNIKSDFINNFSNILTNGRNIITFNPCITHYKDNLYLCSYRVFSRHPEYFDGLTEHSNHPWYIDPNPEVDTFFNPGPGGRNDTEFVLLQITEDGTIKIILEYRDNRQIAESLYDGFFNHLKNKSDARISCIKTDKISSSYIVSYNELKVDETYKIKNKNCKDGCVVISANILHIRHKDNKLFVGQNNLLCPEYSEEIEKNWSFFTHNDKIMFSYGISGDTSIYNINHNKSNDTISCNDKIGEHNDIFTQFNNYYNNNIKISCSTPAIKYTDNIYLSVGHIKYNVSNMDIYPDDSPLAIYTKEELNNGKIIHPHGIVYMMFLYTFSIENYNIIQISGMFTPVSESFVCYPVGITRMNDNKFIISYGVHDESCYCMCINPDEMFLENNEHIPFYTIKTNNMITEESQTLESNDNLINSEFILDSLIKKKYKPKNETAYESNRQIYGEDLAKRIDEGEGIPLAMLGILGGK